MKNALTHVELFCAQTKNANRFTKLYLVVFSSRLSTLKIKKKLKKRRAFEPYAVPFFFFLEGRWLHVTYVSD